MTVVALAGGSGTFALVLVAIFFGVVWTLFTRAGSAISERPYFNQYGGAPGASGSSSVSGHDERVTMRDWSRGAR
ncbi:MAG: hypothetical protein QOC55_411 [Thermoleophilaceae bacterium]|jgi:hypothetical protein|nr:hypothetical protein [Thermoleophilaceae bacterium]